MVGNSLIYSISVDEPCGLLLGSENTKNGLCPQKISTLKGVEGTWVEAEAFGAAVHGHCVHQGHRDREWPSFWRGVQGRGN